MEIWKVREAQIAENLIALWKQDILEWYIPYTKFLGIIQVQWSFILILQNYTRMFFIKKRISDNFSSLQVKEKISKISKYELISQHSTNMTEHSFLSMGFILQPIFQMAITQVCIIHTTILFSMGSAASDCQQHTYLVHEHLQKVLYSYFWIFDFLLYISVLNLFIYYHLASVEACS